MAGALVLIVVALFAIGSSQLVIERRAGGRRQD